jgi:hypothetical protein
MAERLFEALRGRLTSAPLLEEVVPAAGVVVPAGAGGTSVPGPQEGAKKVPEAPSPVPAGRRKRALVLAGAAAVVLGLAAAAWLSVRPGPPVPPDLLLEVRFDDPTMRFGLSLPGKSRRLTHKEDGRTSNTVVRIDGDEGRIFGEGPGGRWKGDKRDERIRDDPRKSWGGRQSVWVYDPEHVTVAQSVELVPGEQSGQFDTCRVRYLIENGDPRQHRVGLRFMLHTCTSDRYGAFIVPGEKELCDRNRTFDTPAAVPDFIEALERGNLTEPGTVALLRLKLPGIDTPDRVQLGAWPDERWAGMPWNDLSCKGSQTLWKVPDHPMKQLVSADSCVTMYWDEKLLRPRETREVGFDYGLGRVAGDGN